jgi:hypothetical protein
MGTLPAGVRFVRPPEAFAREERGGSRDGLPIAEKMGISRKDLSM